MEWKCIKTQAEVDELNELFGNFHDACLKELCFSTGGFVSDNYTMQVISTPAARLLFQRQKRDPAVIELEFSGVLQINIKPVGENEGVDIFSTHLYWTEEIFSGVKKIMNTMKKERMKVLGLQPGQSGGE